MKENKKTNVDGLFFIRSLSLLAIIICLTIFYLWQNDNNKNDIVQSELENIVSIQEITNQDTSEIIILNENILNDDQTQEEIQDLNKSNYNIDVDFDLLTQKNSDTVGWIAFNNLDINYPIVQAKDNSYYLNRNFYKVKNSAGWIYGDYTNNFTLLDKNTIIYGHNRRNGTMFSKLTNYLDSEFCAKEGSKAFLFATKESKYEAQIFSAYKVNATGFTIKTNFENEVSFFDYLKELKEKSNYDFGNIVSPNDRIITLCTCDNNTKYRIVVHARLKLIR